MRAKCIKEGSVFQPKDKMAIIDEYSHDIAWDDMTDPFYEFFKRLMDNGFSYNFILKNEDKIVNILQEKIRSVITYVIEAEMEDYAEELSESLKDTFQPKNREEIIDLLREEEWDEFELEDGRHAWLIEDSFPGMAGETVIVYKIFVDDGSEYTLNNDTLDELPFTMDDRMGLIELIDDTNEENYNNAIAFVK